LTFDSSLETALGGPFGCLVKGIEEFHPDGYYYQRVKRDGKWAWVALGRDPSTAWNKLLAQAKVRDPEFVPGIPGVPAPSKNVLQQQRTVIDTITGLGTILLLRFPPGRKRQNDLCNVAVFAFSGHCH